MKHVLTLLFILIAGMALAGTIKTWSTGETLKATDLNSNFSHVHNAAEATVTDSKVASNAAISHSKLATPALVPKAWALVSATCTVNGSCAVAASSGIASVTRTGTGAYTVTLSYTAGNAAFAVFVTPFAAAAATVCRGYAYSTTTSLVNCYDSAVAQDRPFQILVMDD